MAKSTDYVVQALDEEWDTHIDPVTGSTAIKTGSDAIRQNIKGRLLGLKDEWFLNLDWGLPYYTKILVHGARQTEVQAIIAKTIYDTEGVNEIVSIESSFDRATRTMAVRFEYTDVFGRASSEEIEVGS